MEYLNKHLNDAAEHILATISSIHNLPTRADPAVPSEARSGAPSDERLSPFHSTIADVQSSILSSQAVISNADLTFLDQIRAFSAAVNFALDWKWLSPLFLFHVLCLSSIVTLRSSPDRLFLLSSSLCALAFLSSTINSFLHVHHSEFSSQDYFDSGGLFVAVVWAAPIVLNVSLAVTLMLCESVRMMKVVARGKSRERGRREQQQHVLQHQQGVGGEGGVDNIVKDDKQQEKLQTRQKEKKENVVGDKKDN